MEPQFLTAWEREDYEREKRGQPPLGPTGAAVISIEPMIRIEFSKYGAFAQRHWPSGKVEEMTVENAMREFDKIQAKEA